MSKSKILKGSMIPVSTELEQKAKDNTVAWHDTLFEKLEPAPCEKIGVMLKGVPEHEQEVMVNVCISQWLRDAGFMLDNTLLILPEELGRHGEIITSKNTDPALAAAHRFKYFCWDGVPVVLGIHE